MGKTKQKLLSTLAALCITFSASAGMLPKQSQPATAAGNVLAFPGAVGGGKYATGGRGGEVYHVTNLNDSGEGSFREAVGKSGRIVVFDVSGTIELKGNILCQSNVTILGQTAPGGSGITLKNYKMGMSGDNIICRFISSRPGPYAATSSGNDAWGGAKGSGSIIDHCSMGWTSDEQWGLYSNNEYYTVQYSVLGPANSWGGHSKGIHGFGIMMGKGALTFDHNLIIHNVSRNFRGKVSGTATADFTNNVIYDWGYQTAYGTIGHLNYVNNTLKAGNSTTGGYHWMNVDSSTSPQNFKVYCTGNRLINKDGSFHAITNDNWSGVTVKSGIGITKDDLYSGSPFQTIQNGENLSSVAGAESAEASYNHVISFAGNGIAPEKRTAIDQQCAADTKNGTGSCSGTSAYDASVSDLNKYNIKCGVTYTYPSPVLTKEITDSDNDGMPDEWEMARGLNPNDASDATGDYCGLGYNNIEYYANDLTISAFPEGVVTLSPEENVPATSAFTTIEAEGFTSTEGIKAEAQEDGTGNIGFVENGDYVMYRKLDFEDGARSFTATVSGNPAKIEVYTDGISTKPVATLSFDGTSGFSDYQTITWGIPAITGTHNLYLKFTGSDGYLLNMDSFVFGKDRIPWDGTYFHDLVVAEDAIPADWKSAANAQVGSTLYGDRDFSYTQLPDVLVGAEQIITACNAKNTFTDYASFYAAQDCNLYIALDVRVEDAGKTPDWLSGFTKRTETAVSSNDVTFSIYEKALTTGEQVILGSNNMNGNCICYTVFLKGKPASITTTEITTTTMTNTTTTFTTTTGVDTTDAPAANWGDSDVDGSITVSDAVLLARFAVGDKEARVTEAGARNMDVTHDNRVDADDLTKLLQYLANKISKDALAQA